MHRIDDDTRQARGVQDPLFEVEFPGPILLGQQLALEAIGESVGAEVAEIYPQFAAELVADAHRQLRTVLA